MSLLRRYAFGILVVAVAFAVGIALGGGPLQETSANDGDLAERSSELADQVATLEANQRFDEAFGKAASRGLLGGRLQGESVTVVALPGVEESEVSAMTEAIHAAGGSVPATVLVQPDYTDAAKKTYVDSVATNSLRGFETLEASAGSSTYSRIGTVQARAYTGHSGSLTLDDIAVKLDGQLRGAKLVRLEGDLARRGSLVLVLTAGDHGDDEVAQARASIETDLVSALATRSDGVVVVGPATSSLEGGLIDAVRANPDDVPGTVATVNVAGTPAADVTTVYAMKVVAGGNAGNFGVSGDKVVMPPGLVPGQ